MNRLAGAPGYCGAGGSVEMFRAGPHDGEEPPVSGTRGSGTVFFSRCTLRCLYCQNHPWSQQGRGEAMGVEALADVFLRLARAGCHNLNLVSPTPWWPRIREALDAARAAGAGLPVVNNTSGYEREETLEAYAGVTDVYLADLRYAAAGTAEEASGAADYVEVARRALRAMWRLAGPLELDREGVARRGTICRVLILPGRAKEAVESLEWLRDTFGAGIAVSVMAQYLPAHRAAGRADDWGRRVSREEYDRVRERAEECAFDIGWIQEFGAEAPAELVGFRMQSGALSAGGAPAR